jgi:hypothetical protein
MLHTDIIHVGMVLIMQLRYREVAGAKTCAQLHCMRQAVWGQRRDLHTRNTVWGV